MPFRHSMFLLLAGRVEREHQATTAQVDAAARAALDEAHAKRDLSYEHHGFPLQTKRGDSAPPGRRAESPLADVVDLHPGETFEQYVDRKRAEWDAA